MLHLLKRQETQVLHRGFYICRNFCPGALQISRSVDKSSSPAYAHLLHGAGTVYQPFPDHFLAPPGKAGHWSRSQTTVGTAFGVKISDFMLLNRCFDLQVSHKVGSASHHVLVMHHEGPASGLSAYGTKSERSRAWDEFWNMWLLSALAW